MARHSRLHLPRGLPTTDQEDWKYTDLSELQDLEHGVEDIDGESPARLDSNADGVEAINAAFASGGLDLEVAAGSHRAEVIVAGGNGHRHHRVRLGRGAQARLRLDVQPHAAFQTVVLDLALEAGAHLTLLRLQETDANARHVTRIRARVGRDATLDLSSVSFAAGINFTFPGGTLLAPGARVLVVKDTAAFAAACLTPALWTAAPVNQAVKSPRTNSIPTFGLHPQRTPGYPLALSVSVCPNDHGSVGDVVGGDGPEQRGRWVRRQMQLVGVRPAPERRTGSALV